LAKETGDKRVARQKKKLKKGTLRTVWGGGKKGLSYPLATESHSKHYSLPREQEGTCGKKVTEKLSNAGEESFFLRNSRVRGSLASAERGGRAAGDLKSQERRLEGRLHLCEVGRETGLKRGG